MNAVVLAEGPLGLLLASLRVLALIVAAPVFGHRSIPARVRVSIGLAIGLALSGSLPTPALAEPSRLALFQLAVGELAIGLGLGFACRLIFESAGLVGELASLQGGLGAAIAVDPSSGSSSAALSALLRTAATLVFLAADGHHEIVRAAAHSYELIPVGEMGRSGASFAWRPLYALGSAMFEVALRLAMPIVTMMMALNLAVGILGRSIPQLNLMTLQLPAFVGLTFFMLELGSGEFVVWVRDAYTTWPARVVEAAFGG